MATGIVVARKPVMLGTTRRTTAAPASRIAMTRSGRCPADGAACTMSPASQPLAPLRTSAWASESDEAMTKKFAQPTPRSNSLQDSTPRPGASRHAHASIAGSAGGQCVRQPEDGGARGDDRRSPLRRGERLPRRRRRHGELRLEAAAVAQVDQQGAGEQEHAVRHAHEREPARPGDPADQPGRHDRRDASREQDAWRPDG